MGILDFLALPGQERTRLRDEYLGGLLNYYLGPTGIPERLGLVDMLNPVSDVGRAMTSSQEMLAPDRTPMERVGAGATMLTDIASVAAPSVATRIAGGDAAQAVAEGLLGAPVAVEEAGRRVVERLNQPGPVPTMYSNPFADMTRESFLGSPRITGPSNAASLKPKALRGLEDADAVDFPVGNLTARYDDSGAAVYDGEKVVASYNFGDTLVVDPKYRKQGIGEELVYQWRTRFPAPAATKTRTKVSQRIQENVWDRIQRELAQGTLKTRPATPIGEAHPGGLLIQPSADPAIERGQEVLQMLRSGRASEITDDMLDMGDPTLNARLNMYLFENYDLPMDEASRMARARESGFDTGTPLYRGDQRPDLQRFDTGLYAREGIGVTTSRSPNVAATYMLGDQPAMYSVVSRSQNPLTVEAGGRSWSGISPDAPANQSSLDNLMDLEDYLDEENLFDFINNNTVDWGDGTQAQLAVANTNDISRAAQEYGFDEVRFNNLIDRGGAGRYHTGPANDPHTTVMTADPANIRSRFARFDPRLSHLRNLSAGVGGLGLLATQMPEQQRDEEIRQYLGGLL